MSKVLIRSLRELDDRLKDSLTTSRSGTWSGERLPQSSLSKPSSSSSFFKPSPAKPPAAPSHHLFLRQVQAQIEEIDCELHPHSLSFSSFPATPDPVSLPPPADSPTSPILPEPVSSQQDQEEIKSLKKRLKESLKTIQMLENQLKLVQKDDSNTQSRSFSEAKLTSRSKEASFRQYSPHSLLGEKDSQIRDERKTIARVQSLNRVLLEKLKEVQEQQGDVEELRAKLAKSKRKGRRMREIQGNLEEELRGKEEEIREMEEKYGRMRMAAEEFVEKTEGMYEMMRRLMDGVNRTRS